jgi:tRNA (guanosine-2'-O-)-methyltransferase
MYQPTREEKIRSAIRHTQPDLTVVLENIFDPMNISAVLRSCDAVGVREVFVVYTRQYLDKRGLVLGKRTSGGTFKWTDVYVFDDLTECFRRVRERYGRVLATLPAEGSHSLYDLDLGQPTALLFGNEDEGISTEALALCDGYFTIPMAGFAESLNISVACAVTLYEAYRQRKVLGRYDDAPALTPDQQAQLYTRWFKMLKRREYRNRGTQIDADSEPIPPIFVERVEDVRPPKYQPLPMSGFEL